MRVLRDVSRNKHWALARTLGSGSSAQHLTYIASLVGQVARSGNGDKASLSTTVSMSVFVSCNGRVSV